MLVHTELYRCSKFYSEFAENIPSSFQIVSCAEQQRGQRQQTAFATNSVAAHIIPIHLFINVINASGWVCVTLFDGHDTKSHPIRRKIRFRFSPHVVATNANHTYASSLLI